MDYKAEFTITLPDELLDALGIDEDTIFEAFYEDGKIKVRPLDEADLDEDIEDSDEDEVPEKCVLCPNYCWKCGRQRIYIRATA